MASKQPSNNSVYKSSGGSKNFVESYGGRLWNDADVQEAKAVGAAMKQYDAQQARSGGSAKSSGGSAKSSGGSAKSSGGGAKSSSSRK